MHQPDECDVADVCIFLRGWEAQVTHRQKKRLCAQEDSVCSADRPVFVCRIVSVLCQLGYSWVLFRCILVFGL